MDKRIIMKGINIKMLDMLEQIKRRQKELSNNFLVVRNKIFDLRKELRQNEEQLQKITGAIVEFDRLIQLYEAEKEIENNKVNE